ncbi:MAG: hypothetical protein EBR82_49200 [Caulobacteraceae bacterium]|nr:hypothetical protein [Caulobacteraceae bacterium]
MKILFLNHPESDFGEAFLWNGLIQEAGAENVYDWPVKESYHGTVHHYVRPWCNEPTGTTAPLGWMPGTPAHTEDEQSLREKLREGFFDLVVLGSARPVAIQTFLGLQDSIRAASVPVILHDGEDYASLNTEAWRLVRPNYYLKREWLKSNPFTVKESGTTVFPFPFSAPDCLCVDLPTQFDYTVAALLGGSWDARKDLCDALIDVSGAYVAHGSYPNHETGKHGLKGFDEYIGILRRSRFGVSMRGWGCDTCRYWEVAVSTGLIADELDIHIPNPFHNDTTYLAYSDIESARDMASFVAAGHYQDTRTAGIAHARQFHTNSARVKWLLEQVMP